MPYEVKVTLRIEDEEMNLAVQNYERHWKKPCTDLKFAAAQDIQDICYDDGGMHGTFNVDSVTKIE